MNQPPIYPGSIIWAYAWDENRQGLKNRPMVVIKTQGNELVCVCITSQVDQVPDGKRVLIPIDLVELEKKSAAHCGWVRYVAIDQVQEVMSTRLPKMVFDAIVKLSKV